MAETVEIMRALHLLFAVLWGGGGLYHGLITMGFLNRHTVTRRSWWGEGKFGPYLGFTSLLTVVFGLWTFFLVGPENYGDVGRRVLEVGMVAGFFGMLLGWAGHLPTTIRLAKAVKEGEEATVLKLEAREELLDKFSLGLITVTVLAMATFRLF